jgi:hypothetical protein
MTRLPGIALALVIGTFAIYGHVADHELLHWDDDLYIFDSADLEGGLGLGALRRAFTEPYQMAWMPVTKLSLLANHALHGVAPAGYLLGNVALHALAAVLLLFALAKLTGDLLPSAFVAAVFAFHPLHVESVAWASERKDVLAGVFWMATLLAYARFVDRPRSVGRYAWVVVPFALGLMSKAMLVTLPCVLLLLDFWPLGRLRSAGVGRVLLEKVPLLALAAAVSVLTLMIQDSAGAVAGGQLPLGIRLTNAVHSYLAYLGDAFWPTDLVVFHSYGEASLSVVGAVVGAGILLVFSGGILVLARSQGYLATGWLWYLGTLVPVIGIVQVGMQARADRYMYLPLVGLSIAVAWGVRDLWRRLDGNPRVLTGAGVVCAVLLGVAAWVQVGHWRDTETLFRRAIAVEEGNFVAHRILGDEYLRRGAIERAALHYRASLHIKGDSVLTHSRLAAALARLGRAEDAVVNLEIAAGLDPGSLRRTLDLARGLVAAGRSEEARGLAEDALRTAQDRGDVAMATAFAELLGSLGDSDQSR